MLQILPDIFLIEGLRRSNVYLLVSPDGLTRVDSGVPGEVEKIRSQDAQLALIIAHWLPESVSDNRPRVRVRMV